MGWVILDSIAFAILTEAVIEYGMGNIKPLQPYIPLLSLASAFLLALLFPQVRIFHIFVGGITVNPFLDILLSAFIIARLSNYLNDLVQKFLGSK